MNQSQIYRYGIVLDTEHLAPKTRLANLMFRLLFGQDMHQSRISGLTVSAVKFERKSIMYINVCSAFLQVTFRQTVG